MDFSKEIVKKFQTDANLMMAFIARIAAVLLLVVMLLNYAGVFIISSISYPVLAISILIMLLPTLFYNVLHKDSVILKYIFLTMMVFMSGLLYSIFSYHTIIMLVFPVVLSCLYCNKGNVIYVSILSVPVMVVSHLIAFQLKIVPDEPLVTLHGVIYYGILPRLLEFSSICVVCVTMMDKIHDLVVQLVTKNNDLYEDQQKLITSLSELVEAQSQETGQHVKRVCEYTRVLCQALGMPENDVWKISTAAMMHDIGKILVPREIIEKPGKLTEQEFEVIKKHTSYGKRLLEKSPGELMQIAAQIAYEHHERYDGNGYKGMKAEEISLGARCVSIADVFDALVSWRPYKAPWNVMDAKEEIISQKGKQFDPGLVELFEVHFDEFVQIFQQYPDAVSACDTDAVLKTNI